MNSSITESELPCGGDKFSDAGDLRWNLGMSSGQNSESPLNKLVVSESF